MSYISPLHIVRSIDDDATADLTPDYLLRVRKRLLAELNLSGESSILIGGKEHTKDTIIKTIDQLLHIKDLELHDFIYRHSFLLNFLEDEAVLIDIDRYAALSIPGSIRQQFDTLLSERFILQFRKGISSRKFAIAERALTGMNFLESNLRLACYEDIHRALGAFHIFLQELRRKVNRYTNTQIEFLTYPSLAVFLNALPDGFSEVKQQIIARIINIVTFYSSLSQHRHELVISISNVLMLLECNEEQSAIIRNNHERFTSYHDGEFLWPPSPSTRSNSTSPALANLDFRFFLWVITAIFCAVIFRGLLDNGSNDIPREEYKNPAGSELISHKSSVTTTLSDLRKDVVQFLAILPEVRTGYFVNRVHPVVGLAPLKDPQFFTYQSDFSNCTETLTIKNTTGYDLIVFEYDSLENRLRSLFISKGVSEKISFNLASRFVFYFGNRLSMYSIPRFNSITEHEFFGEAHTHSTDILLNTYVIRPMKGKKAEEFIVTLDPAFLETPAKEYPSGNVSLVRIEQF
jgi:hypothetical protein